LLSVCVRAARLPLQIGALSALVELSGPERETALAEFYERWKGEPLVVLKWLGLQVGGAGQQLQDGTERLKQQQRSSAVQNCV
jgi:hypothetical protein